MLMLMILFTLIATVIAVETESVDDKRSLDAGMRTFAFAKKRYYPSTFAFAKRSSPMIETNSIDDDSATAVDKRRMSSFAKRWQSIDGYGSGIGGGQRQFAFAKRRFSQFA